MLWLAHTGPRNTSRLSQKLSSHRCVASRMMFSRSISRRRARPFSPTPALRVRALRVHARSVVRRPDGAQALRVRPLQVVQRDDRVGAFEAEDVADRRVLVLVPGFRRAPVFEMVLQRGRVADVHHLAGLFHGAGTTPTGPASGPRPAPGNASPESGCPASRIAQSASRRTCPPGRAASRRTTRCRSRDRAGRSCPVPTPGSRAPSTADRGSTRGRSSRGRGARRRSAVVSCAAQIVIRRFLAAIGHSPAHRPCSMTLGRLVSRHRRADVNRHAVHDVAGTIPVRVGRLDDEVLLVVADDAVAVDVEQRRGAAAASPTPPPSCRGPGTRMPGAGLLTTRPTSTAATRKSRSGIRACCTRRPTAAACPGST